MYVSHAFLLFKLCWGESLLPSYVSYDPEDSLTNFIGTYVLSKNKTGVTLKSEDIPIFILNLVMLL